MYADPTLMDLAAAYAKRSNGRKTKHAVACDRPGAKAKFVKWFTDRTKELLREAPYVVGETKKIAKQIAAQSAQLEAKLNELKAIKDPSAMEVRDRIIALHNSMTADISQLQRALPNQFSRPGAKAEFEMSANEKASLAAHFRAVTILLNKAREDLFAAEKSGDNAALRKAREEIQHYSKQREDAIAMLKAAGLMSRPGAKAKMGRMLQPYEVTELREFLESYGVTKHDIIKSIGQVKVSKSQVGKALDAIAALNREIQKEGIGDKVVVDVVPFSRPGAKAKMALAMKLTPEQKKFYYELWNFWTPERQKNPTEHEAELRALVRRAKSMPDFRVTAAGQRMPNLHELADEQEDRVKSYSSRTGTKAKFAQPPFSASDLNALKRLVKQYEQQAKANKGKQGPNGENLEFKALSIAGWMQEMINYAQAGQTGRAYSIVRTSNPDYLRFLPASLVKAAQDVTKMSRPGAKAKSTHAALPPQTLEAERKPGGGSHSEAVSRKIATLINEGKPQDQAVAIALDLERRGEL
jgi:hypothetical protein